MKWEIWGPVFAPSLPILTLLLQAIGKKLLARINNIPDEKQRRQATAEEHAAEMERLALMQEQLTGILEKQQAQTDELKKTNAAVRALAKRFDAVDQTLAGVNDFITPLT